MTSVRNKFDFYPTPFSIAHKLLDEAMRWNGPYWEPCAGDGRLVDMMIERGGEVVSGDIQTGQDFFGIREAWTPVLVTNPPFKQIRQFIDHAFAIGVKRMGLVCPERIFASKIGASQFRRHRPSLFVNMDWREDYLNKGGAPDRALAAVFWDSPCADQTVFDVWSKKEDI